MDLVNVNMDYESLLLRNQKLKYKERHLNIVNDFAIELIKKNKLDEIVWFIAKKVVARLDFPDCIVYLYDEEQDLLIQKAAHGPKNPHDFDIKNPITIKVGEGVVGSAALLGVTQIVIDTRKDNRYIVDDNIRLSEISVPIIFEDKIIGVIDSEHSDVGFYTFEHRILLETIAAISATKLMQSKTNEKLKSYQKNLEIEVDNKTRELQKSIYKLQKSNEDLESFAYAASHDLQEPIRTIASYLQLIQRKEKMLQEDSKEFLNFAIEGSKRMRKLLEGLLEYSKLKSDVENEIVDLDDLFVLVNANLYATIRETKCRLNLKPLGQVMGNKFQLVQLFQNILSNAIKFRREDVVPVINISSEIKDHFNVILVEDNGIGIDPSFAKKIFNLFSRLNTIDKYKGSGIGLALCKRIVENHNGEISVNSVNGEGSVFKIALPSLESKEKS